MPIDCAVKAARYFALGNDVPKGDFVVFKQGLLFAYRFGRGFAKGFPKDFPESVLFVAVIKVRLARDDARETSENQYFAVFVEERQKSLVNHTWIIQQKMRVRY